MTWIVVVVGLVGLGIGLLLGCVYGLGLSLRILRSVRDCLPLLEPTDGTVARRVLQEFAVHRRWTGFHTPGEAITRLESGGRR